MARNTPPTQSEGPTPPTGGTGAVRPRGELMDMEMKVMNSIRRSLKKLPDERTRLRVLRWMFDKVDFHLVDQLPRT